MANGYADRILRVDLSARRTWTEPLPPREILRKYVGGTALGLYYLATMTPKGAKSGDPDVPLIFMTGPLAGTRAPSSSNYVVVSLHYDIPYAAGAGHAHGNWAAFLKHANYEGIVVTGQSDTPVYLVIDDEKVELRDARHLWGTGTRETERLVRSELGLDADQVADDPAEQLGTSEVESGVDLLVAVARDRDPGVAGHADRGCGTGAGVHADQLQRVPARAGHVLPGAGVGPDREDPHHVGGQVDAGGPVDLDQRDLRALHGRIGHHERGQGEHQAEGAEADGPAQAVHHTAPFVMS